MSELDGIIVEGMSQTATNNLTDGPALERQTAYQQQEEAARRRRQADTVRMGPATLDFLQKSENAYRIANMPEEWENLGMLEKAYAAWRIGSDDADLAAAARDVVDAARVPDYISENDLTDEEREHAAETGLSSLLRTANRIAQEGEWGDKKRAEHIRRTWEFAEAARRKREYTAPKIMEELSAEKTFGGAFNKFLDDPLNLMAFIGTSSIAGQWQYLLAAAPAYALGPLAGAAVTGFGSYRLDRAAGLLQGLSDAGVDLTDSEAVRAYLADPSHVQSLIESAGKHAQGVAAFDFLAGLVAPLELSAFARAAGTARAVRNAARGRPGALSAARLNRTTDAVRRTMSPGLRKLDELMSTSATGAILGAAGEAAGQLNAGQELNWGDILAEAIGEYFTLPVEAVSARVGMSLQNYKQLKKVQFAARSAEVFPKIVEAAKLSVLRANDPNAFHQLVKNMGESAGARDVYVSNQDLRQTDGLIDALKAAVPTLAPKIDEAVRTGGDLTIPLADLTTDAVTSNGGLVNALKPVVRIDPDGMSYREAEAFVNSEEMQKFGYAYIEEATRKKMLDTAFSNELDEIMSPIEKQFMAARSVKQTPDMVRASMRPYRAALGHMANLAGMSPKEFAERFPMSVARVADAASRAGLPVERDSKTGEALMQGVPAKSVDAVRAQYEGTDTWMKAPNGQPTKLTETQWLQVRTPEFKAWFGDWEAAALRASTVARLQRWVDLIGQERGKSREEIFADLPNTPEPIAVIPERYLGAFREKAANGVVYSGCAYFVDHALNHHAEVPTSWYAEIQEVFDNPSEIIIDRRARANGEPRDNLIFVKNLSPARAVTVSLEVGEDGRVIFHKTVHGTRKKLHPSLPRVQPLPVGGPSTIDTAETNSAFAGGLSGSGENNSTLSASKVVDENGEPKVMWHQTRAEHIEVFDTRRKGAGMFDNETPFGIFLKPDASDIGLGGVQMPLFVNVRNPIRFADRRAMSLYLESSVEGYKALSDEYQRRDKDFEARYAAQEDKDFEALDKKYTQDEWAALSEKEREDEVNKASAESERILQEWKGWQEDISSKMKALVDAHFSQSEYDGVHIDRDDGSFGRSVETTIALNNNQIKSATGNNGNFDPADANIYHQTGKRNQPTATDLEFLSSQSAWLNWMPPETSTGKILGAPPEYDTNRKFAGLRTRLKKFIREGTVGRYWYEDSAEWALAMVGGDVKEAERLIQFIAIYSPQMKIGSNLLLALRAYTHWKLGRPEKDLHLKTGAQDKKARDVLWRNAEWAGRKTNTFYQNLMYAIVTRHTAECEAAGIDVKDFLSGQSTIDMWMKRAFSYDSDATTDDKGTGQYSFCEKTLRRVTAELNAELPAGAEPWTPHQVQAAIWTGVMARYEIVHDKTDLQYRKKGLAELQPVLDKKTKQPKIKKDGTPQTKWVRKEDPESQRSQMRLWYKNAMAVKTEDAKAWADKNARSYATEFKRMVQQVTWEAMPSEDVPGAKALLNAPMLVRQMFTEEVARIFEDANGKSELAEKLGIPFDSDLPSFGGYKSAISPNIIARLLKVWWGDQGEPSKDAVRKFCRAIQYVCKQDAVPFFRIENRPAWIAKNVFRVVDPAGKQLPRKYATQSEAEEVAKSKGDGFTVKGGNLARGVVFVFDEPVAQGKLKELLDKIDSAMGGQNGLSRISETEVLVANYRDNNGIPFAMTDENFIEAMKTISIDGLVDAQGYWIDSEYGHEQDWKADKDGDEILKLLGFENGNQGSNSSGSREAGSQHDSLSRNDLARWRSAYEEVFKRYTGAELDKRKAEAAEIERQSARAESQVLNQAAVAGQEGALTLSQLPAIPMQVLDQRLYHGSPYYFDAFSLDHVGEGEGAQAHGWGIYFALDRVIAAGYRAKLGGGNPRIVETETGRELQPSFDATRDSVLAEATRAAVDDKGRASKNGIAAAARKIVELADKLIKDNEGLLEYLNKQYRKKRSATGRADVQAKIDMIERSIEDARKRKAYAEEIAKAPVEMAVRRTGRVYEVEIPNDDVMLFEQRRLNEQPPKVREACRKILQELHDNNPDLWNERIGSDVDSLMGTSSGGDFYIFAQRLLGDGTDNSRAMSMLLLQYGVQGIRYKGGVDGECAVVFSDEAVKVIDYWQSQQDANRGTFNTGTGVMTLFSAADASTFIHESGHYFFNAMGVLASEIIRKPAADRTAGEVEIMSMMGGFLKWAGVEGESDDARVRAYLTVGPDEQRRIHEQFARGYEAYTREGEAPTSALSSIFNKFKEWLMRIYRDASELNVEMSDEVRDLYARMFRSEAEAAALREEAQMKALFPDAQSGGLSEEEWQALNSFYAEAAQAVEAAVRANRERNYKILRNKEERVKRGIQQDWENIENEVAAEVDAQPERQAERILSSGMQTADGETVRFKLWAPDLASLNLPPQAVQVLEEKGYTVRDRGQTPIVTPRILADMLGAPDAVMLLTNLASLPDRDQVIQEQTEQKFFEKHGDFPDEDGINSLARERIALHSDAYSKALAAEYRALQRLAKIPSALKQMTREVAARFAKQAVGRTQVRNLKPLINERAEAAAGREARAALGKSDFAAALDAKRRQILQHYLSKEGEQARAEIAKALARVKRVLKSKTIHGSFMEQLENLAARFKLVPSLEVNKQTQPLADFVEAQQENGYFFEFDELVTSGVELPYQALTIEQFREVMLAFDQLAHVGREMQNLTINGQQVSTRDAVAQAREILKANAADRGREPHYDWDKEKPSAGAGLFRFLRNHVKVSTWCRIFDGAERGGFWWNLFSRRANACGDRETQLRGELTQTMTQILSGILSKYDMDEVVAHTNITLTDQRTGQLTNVPREITRDNRLALALNWGNDGNRQRIRAGFGLTDTEVERILYGMSAEEWQAVEAIWKTFEALRPELEALEKRIYGRAPQWVEYTPFEVQIGPNQTMTVSGGYYPIMYDKNVNSLADSRDAAKDAEVMMHNAFEAVRTDRSHMKARAAKNNQPVSLRFTGVFDALNNEVHDLCWREFVIDAERLLRGGLKDTIRDYYSADVARIFQNWVRDLAVGDKRARGVEGEQWSSWLRQGVGLAGLGFNITSAIAQLTGILATASHLGTATLRGVAIYSRNPIAATREACEESLFMKNRGKTRFRELNEVANRIKGRPEALEKVHRGGYFLLLKVQQVVDTVTWHAAYTQAAEQGRTHEEAVAMADQAVLDTQGGGELKDLSQIERGGPISKLFTVFYSFMNTAFNLNAGAYLGEKNRYKAAAKILTLSVIMPVLEQMIRAALPAGGDDDDDEDPQEKTVKMLRKAAGDIVDFNLGTLMVAREVSNVLGNAIAGEPIFGYKGPAGTRVIGDFVGTVQQVSQGEFDAALVKSLVNLSGDLFGLPSAQINRAISTAQAVEKGKIEGPAEIAQGVLFGVQR